MDLQIISVATIKINGGIEACFFCKVLTENQWPEIFSSRAILYGDGDDTLENILVLQPEPLF